MQARMNLALAAPEAMAPIKALYTASQKNLSPITHTLVHLRVSQINGCSVCVDSGVRQARAIGVKEEGVATVAAWRDAPYFDDAQRAALALAECVTRMSDRSDPVPDAVWDEAARHYDEKGLAALLLTIAVTNVFNHLNVPTRQVAGATW